MRTHPLRPSKKLKTIYRFVLIGALVLYVLLDSLVFNLLALLILAGFFYYYRVTVRIKQQALNAALAYTSLAENSYFVYLRSFDSAGRRKIRNYFGDWTERSLVGQYWDLEHALTALLEQQGLLVAIGDKGQSVGAAKFIATDDDWKLRFSELCSRAKAIFVLPDSSNSLLWEIRQLISNPKLSLKTFFLMPPRRRPFIAHISNVFFASLIEHRGSWWKRIQTALAKGGVDIPDYDAKGQIFQLTENGVTNQHPFDRLHGRAIVELMSTFDSSSKFISPQEKAWFDKWPIRWTLLSPGAFLPLLVSLFVVVFIRTFLFQPFSIPAGSMKSTLLVGDYLFVSKYTYGYSKYSLPSPPSFSGRIPGDWLPQRGDVVVFRLPKDPSTDYIKRVIGLPGDRIQVIDGVVSINGVPVKHERAPDFIETEEGVREAPVKRWKETLPNGATHYTLDLVDNGFADNTEVYRVPPDHYFMMGDNRDNSTDSRFSQVGMVPFENLEGKAQMIFFSVYEGERAWQFWRWPVSVRWNRLFTIVK